MVNPATNPSPLVKPFTATGSAPCKINLTLDVFAPRPDGFHDLASLVVPMAYPADTVTVSVKHGSPHDLTQITLTCDDPTLPTDEKNLAFRAARDFARAFLPANGVRVHVDLIKRLPHQAGLGGGSSDAATVLRLLALKHLGHNCTAHPANPSVSDAYVARNTELNKIAARIGSDVPLFLSNQAVWMSGRGEITEPARFWRLHGVLVKPAVGVPTGPAYALLDALPLRHVVLSPPPVIRTIKANAGSRFQIPSSITSATDLVKHYEQSFGISAEWDLPELLGPIMHNDFEAAVLPAYPEVARAYEAVQEAGAVRALLCGSGSAVFGLADDKNHARELARRLQGKFPYVAETSTLADSKTNEQTEPLENA